MLKQSHKGSGLILCYISHRLRVLKVHSRCRCRGKVPPMAERGRGRARRHRQEGKTKSGSFGTFRAVGALCFAVKTFIVNLNMASFYHRMRTQKYAQSI